MKVRPRFWEVMWTLGIALWLILIPTMLGFYCGMRLEAHFGDGSAPFRILLALLGGGLGSLAAWRVLAGSREPS